MEVYAAATDSSGQPVRGLARDDFEVREDGVAQTITTFTAGDVPLSVAVAIDRSFSMAGRRLDAAKMAARTFLDELRPGDESMIVAIGSEVTIAAPLTRNRVAQRTELERLDAFGTTGLHDAVVASIAAVQPAQGRRALLLISDGSDRYSDASAADAVEVARRSDVMIYPIAVGASRPELFVELAALTGGRSHHARDAAALRDAVRLVARDLREQYLLGYTPSKPIVAGQPQWRSIEVRVRRAGVQVRARDGYVVR